MQVQAGRDRSFYKGLAQAVLTDNDQGDGTLDARAAPRVFSHGIAINQRRLAHVCSIEMPPDASSSTRLSSAKDIFSAARQKTRSKREPASGTSMRRSRKPRWQMLAEARSIVDICVEGSRIPAVQILRILSGGDETS